MLRIWSKFWIIYQLFIRIHNIERIGIKGKLCTMTHKAGRQPIANDLLYILRLLLSYAIFLAGQLVQQCYILDSGCLIENYIK